MEMQVLARHFFQIVSRENFWIVEKCQKNIEYWQKQAATELDNLTFEQYQSEKWTKRQRELHKRFEELSEEYLQQNLIWYEKYQEYEEAFSDYLE